MVFGGFVSILGFNVLQASSVKVAGFNSNSPAAVMLQRQRIPVNINSWFAP